MEKLTEQCRDYLKETLGSFLIPQKWLGLRTLPLSIRERYECYTGSLFDVSCIFAVVKSSVQETPVNVRKHLNLIMKQSGLPVIYVHPAITSWNRKRLLQQHVPFIVPGNQMFLPPLGIDFREFYKKSDSVAVKSFSPAAQQVLLYLLYTDQTEPLTVVDLAEMFGYSKMTISRVFKEIKGFGVDLLLKSGRSTLLQPPGDKKSLWDEVLPGLSSPVIRRLSVNDAALKGQLLPAGESALALMTDLAEPSQRIFAMSTGQWRAAKQQDGIRVLDPSEQDGIIMEIWAYPPDRFNRDAVDTLSLYLSLRAHPDERIQASLSKLLEEFKW